MRNETILIIDDTPANIYALEQLLEKPGRSFLTATNGKAGLTLALNKEIDLLILDVQMPELDGFEVAQILKSGKHTKDIPIIFASAEKTGRTSIMKGFDEGAIDYLSKPLDPEITKAKVAVLLHIQRQKRELQEKNITLEKSALLINNSADIIGIIDSRTLKFEQVNQAFTSLLGYSEKEALEAPINFFLHESAFEIVQAFVKTHRQHLSFETPVYTQQRATRWLHWHVTVKDHTWFVNARDITQLHDQKIEIEKQNRDLENALDELKATQNQLIHAEKMSSVGQLTAGLLHEINNPINFIQSGAETLQQNIELVKKVVAEYEKITPENFSEQFRQLNALKHDIQFHELTPELDALVTAIRNGASRTSSIIRGLGRFSRKGEGDLSLIPIREPIEDTLLLVKGELKDRIDVETDFGKELYVSGHMGELEQVFMNIIMNASQAIEGKGKITITTRELSGKVVISIKDTGPGIPEAIQKKIFDPFFTTKKIGKGMGLGLSITHGIIKAHHGEIRIVSDGSNGTEFIISMPGKKFI